MTRTRYATFTCEGCGYSFNPEWKSTATVEGQERTVCATCGTILARLGIPVQGPTG